MVPETFPGIFWCPDLISTRDLGPQGVEAVLHLAELMKSRPSVFQRALAGKQMVMFFEKPSLRTRLTFEAGMTSLGGTAMFVDQTQGRLDAREKLSDIAHNLERWVDVIVLRTFSQETIEGMAAVCVGSGDQRAQRSGASVPGAGGLLHSAGAVRRSQEDYAGLCRRWQQRRALAAADVRVPGIVDPDRDAEGLRAECADCGRRAEDREADWRAHRIAERSACGGRGSRCGLHRRVGQHGPGDEAEAAR